MVEIRLENFMVTAITNSVAAICTVVLPSHPGVHAGEQVVEDVECGLTLRPPHHTVLLQHQHLTIHKHCTLHGTQTLYCTLTHTLYSTRYTNIVLYTYTHVVLYCTLYSVHNTNCILYTVHQHTTKLKQPRFRHGCINKKNCRER